MFCNVLPAGDGDGDGDGIINSTHMPQNVPVTHAHTHTNAQACTTLGLFFHFSVQKFANFAVICVFMLPARGNTTRSLFLPPPCLPVGNSPDWQSLHQQQQQQQQQKLTESQTVNENKPKS